MSFSAKDVIPALVWAFIGGSVAMFLDGMGTGERMLILGGAFAFTALLNYKLGKSVAEDEFVKQAHAAQRRAAGYKD